MKVLCIASDVLGNRTFSEHLIAALHSVSGLSVDVLQLHPDDYVSHRAPVWTHPFSPFHTRSVLRTKLRTLDMRQYDGLFLEFWEATLAVPEWSRTLPTALAMDLLPSLAWELSALRTTSAPRRLIKRTAWRAYDHVFTRAVAHVDVFAPICHWVADALERDYGVTANRAHVTYVPVDLDRWVPISREARSEGRRSRLLFVGNDFVRKGGQILLDAYREELSDVATLTIASHDPIFDHLTLPDGVTLLRDRDRRDLLEEYQQAELFVFPTRADILPNVLAEALATGLPCMATDVGGISDLVRSGVTGELVPYAADAVEWGRRVKALLADRERLAAMSLGARDLAERELGMPYFTRMVAETIEQLREGKRSQQGSFRAFVPTSENGRVRAGPEPGGA